MASAAPASRCEALDALASLLAYPDESFPAQAAAAEAVLAAANPSAAATVAPFLRAARSASRTDLEERYARTFDWSTACGLEIGWHLFGERYERGAFLADMRGRLRLAGVEEGTDLPDHLGACLRWLGRAEPADAARLARDAMLPALSKIRAGLPESGAPWSSVLEAVEAAVRDVGGDAGDGGGR